MADLRAVETTEYDKLFAGLNRDEIKTFPVIVASGQNLKRGALVTFAMVRYLQFLLQMVILLLQMYLAFLLMM